MLELVKQALRRTPLAAFVAAARSRRAIQRWQEQGRPVPPPAYKQSIAKDFGRRFQLKAFAKARFVGLDKIAILEGDSSDNLRHLAESYAEELGAPCLFWLDAHYSGGITARGARDTPIMQELQIILARQEPGDVILIDDARCFDGTNDYPALADLQRFVAEAAPRLKFEVADDIIRLYHLAL